MDGVVYILYKKTDCYKFAFQTHFNVDNITSCRELCEGTEWCLSVTLNKKNRYCNCHNRLFKEDAMFDRHEWTSCFVGKFRGAIR